MALAELIPGSFDLAGSIVVRAWLAAAGLLALAGLGRRHLPAGVGEVLVVVALSGALLSPYLQPRGPLLPAVELSVLLTGLAIVWHLAVRWIERAPRGAVAPALQAPPRIIAGGLAVVACGLAVAALSLRLGADVPARERLLSSACLVLLAALAVRRWVDGGAPLSRYAILALLGCALRLWAQPASRVMDGQARLALILLAVAAVAQLVILVPSWTAWRFRRRAWRTDPARLADSPRPTPALATIVTGMGVLVGLGGLFAPQAALSPLAVGLASLAAFTAEHRHPRLWAGEVGFLLAAEGILLAAGAWLPRFGMNLLLGTAIAAGYLLWLARFWEQQLLDGTPWTTAGRLIPLARRLGVAGGTACAAVAVAVSGGEPATAWGRGLVAATLLALAGLASMLVRAAGRAGVGGGAGPGGDFDTTEKGGGTTGTAAGGYATSASAAALAAAVPLHALLIMLGVASWVVALAIIGLLLAARLGRPSEGADPEAAYNVVVAGIPAALALLASAGAFRTEATPALVAAGLCAGLACLDRWCPRYRSKAALLHRDSAMDDGSER